ncbi:MAG: DUF3592 domain-containing protein [Desulfosarcinaceae bacterium]
MKNFFLGAVFLCVGVGVALLGRHILREAGESENWPSTSGVIVVSTVSQSREYDSSRKKTKTVYRANIDYTYQVEGRKFHGDKISFGGKSTKRKSAYRLTSKYPKNKAVDVYFKPGEPENSVLEPGKTWLTYLPFLSGLLFAVVGAGLVLKPLLKLMLVAVLAVTGR